VIPKSWGDDSRAAGREGLVGERPAKEIGMHAVRARRQCRRATIVFSTLGETMELVHKGLPRRLSPRRHRRRQFSAGKPPDVYTMNDVLGL